LVIVSSGSGKLSRAEGGYPNGDRMAPGVGMARVERTWPASSSGLL